MHSSDKLKFRGFKPPGRGAAKMCFFCLFVTFFALAYRSHGLIFKYFVAAVELMATGCSARAMTFLARGQVGSLELDFGVENFPSEMHGKIVRPQNLGNGACSSKKNEFLN